jgi:hypothetical protein
LCGSLCIANSSVSGCGSRCTACPTPAHGSATCTGSNPVCGITCNTNYHQCDNGCVATTDPNNCGPSCATCPGDAHGRATCSGIPGTCGITCRTGYQWCARLGKCVDPTDPTTCGSNCDQCPAGPGSIATCTGVVLKCGLVPQPCLDLGMHVCGFACVDKGVTSCGVGCVDCTDSTVPDHSDPVCANGACDFACVDGYHECSGTCVANASPTACGSGCNLCSGPPANGHAICDNTGNCGLACDRNFHSCGVGTDTPTCVADNSTSLASCGKTCSACPGPVDTTHTFPTCDGIKCGLSCVDGYHLCIDSCFANDSPTHCGSDCAPCGDQEVCLDGVCGTPDAGS